MVTGDEEETEANVKADEQKAEGEAETKVDTVTEQKTKEEVETTIKVDAEQKAKEATEAKTKVEAEQKAKEKPRQRVWRKLITQSLVRRLRHKD